MQPGRSSHDARVRSTRERGLDGGAMKFLLAVVACVVCAGEMYAADTTFHSGVDLVPLNVIVTDAHDKFVRGLNQADFSVYEDGVQQDVAYFAASNVPLDVAILLDSSSSMTDRMATVQQAAVGFASHLHDGDRITVIGVKETARTLHPLDGDVKGACDAIRHTSASGGTALYNALYATIKELQKLHTIDGEVRRQAIAVLTDGQDTASLVTADDLLGLARDAGIAIYTITLKSPYPVIGLNATQYDAESDFAMKALAQDTGARSFFPTDISQLSGVYSVITDELANQYALAYAPKNLRLDGAYHHISVRVSEPNVRTRTRSGYQANKSPLG